MASNFFFGNSADLIALAPSGANITQNELHARIITVTFGDKIINMGGGADILLAGQTGISDTVFANAGNDMALDKLYAFGKPFYGVPFENGPEHHAGLYYWGMGAHDETRTNSYRLVGHDLVATSLRMVTEYHGPGVHGAPMFVSDFNRTNQTVRVDGEIDVIRFTEDGTRKVGAHFVTQIRDVFTETHDAPAAFPGSPVEVHFGFTAHDKAGYSTPRGSVDHQLFTNDDFFRIDTAHGSKAEKLAAIQDAFDAGYHHGGVDGHGWLVDLS